MPETLNSGDLTTAYAKWLDTKTLTGTLDKVVVARNALVTHYTFVPGHRDFTTLLSMFLRRVAP